MAFGEIIIFTTTSLGRTKILQFFHCDPPKVAQPKLTFVLGRMGTSAQNDGGSAHPSTHGYMILAHIKSPKPQRWYKQTSAKCQFLKTIHKIVTRHSLQNLENQKIYSKSNIFSENLSSNNQTSLQWWIYINVEHDPHISPLWRLPVQRLNMSHKEFQYHSQFKECEILPIISSHDRHQMNERAGRDIHANDRGGCERKV